MRQQLNGSIVNRFPIPANDFFNDVKTFGASDPMTSRLREDKFFFQVPSTTAGVPAYAEPCIRYRQKPLTASQDYVLRITVDADCVTELRHLILGTCGDLVQYIRVQPVDHASKMKVWLCLNKSSIDTIISQIMRALPQAEFGKISPVLV